MKVQIQSVADRGDLSRERLVMRVRQDVDIGDFILIRTGFEDDEVTTDVSNAFWFPYQRLRAGDLVVVYSKQGIDRRKQLDDGHKAYFFYWHQDSSLWNDEHVAPVLLYAPQWASKAPRELSAVQRSAASGV